MGVGTPAREGGTGRRRPAKGTERMRRDRQNALLIGIGALAAAGLGFWLVRRLRPPAGLSRQEVRFARDAARCHANLIEVAHIAGIRAQRDDVRDFAQRLVNEHSEALTNLEDIAAYLGITLEREPTRKIRRFAGSLAERGGLAIDNSFLAYVLDAHEATIDMLHRFVAESEQPELNAYASGLLPKLEQHLQQSESLNPVVGRASEAV